MESIKKEFIVKLFKVDGVKFGNFKMKVGVMSPIYFDFRILVSHPEMMEQLAEIMKEMMTKNDIGNVDQLCGVPYTALPIATLLSLMVKKPMLVKRKEAKEYGTKKMVEGQFKDGDTCLIIEDVITSGSSIIETSRELEREGLQIKDCIVVLDRQQGGRKHVEDQGVKVHSLFTIDDVIEILHKEQKIDLKTVEDVRNYIRNSQIGKEKLVSSLNISLKRRKLNFTARAERCKNALARKLYKLMEEKESMLCLAADVGSSKELLDIAKTVGQHICILKTHIDAIADFNEETVEKLKKLSKNLNFLIMEDRKFADIGNTVSLQYGPISDWADIVTAHSLPGEGVLLGLKKAATSQENRGCFLVAQLSCEGSLITEDYSKSTLEMAKKHSDFVVGLVAQSDIFDDVDLIQLTPGVKINSSGDGLKQNYNDPEFVVLEKGADVIVVGRGILESQNPVDAAVLYKEKSWQAYLRRIC